ncbi:hypothetical protein [Methyloceanibacter caenitepidi]|uniref:Uncharacterized protein n=1 Tax=Methyloceanibacter caenitepidi TaxID=1384459 RepID=A0A0A8K4S5_9HYPH|nr:hypothetical protein [Methyloceanibacter caenitepidi]BAQ17928.1 hypothetical protein GL4_2494 [Methyloceanibacter caenitepidi]
MARPQLKPNKYGKRPATVRSKLTNGTALHAEQVGDNKASRRFKDLVEAFGTELGGWASLSEVQRSLVRRLATITIQLEKLELQAARGEDINAEEYARIAGHQRRLFNDLNLIQDKAAPAEPAAAAPEPQPTYDAGKLHELPDDELLTLMNKMRRENAQMPLTSIFEWPRDQDIPRWKSPVDFKRKFPAPPPPTPEPEPVPEHEQEVPEDMMKAVLEILG